MNYTVVESSLYQLVFERHDIAAGWERPIMGEWAPA